MKDKIEILGYYIGQVVGFAFVVWSASILIGLGIRLTTYAWGLM